MAGSDLSDAFEECDGDGAEHSPALHDARGRARVTPAGGAPQCTSSTHTQQSF